MRVFVTGATGFVGSAIVAELLRTGHQVVGLARSDAAAESLALAGAQVHRGALEDLDSLRAAAVASDGVIHTAFIHDWANYPAAAETDRRAIETLGTALEHTGRPLIVTSGTALVARNGALAMENDGLPPGFPRVSEQTALPFASKGVRVIIVRLSPTVHSTGDHGFVPMLIATARNKGVSVYIGHGRNRWSAVHRLDAAVLYRLALESAPAGTVLHGVAEQGVEMREIASVIGANLNVPVISKPADEAADHFGFIGQFVSLDCPASSAFTRQLLGWQPAHPTLIDDLNANYFTLSRAAEVSNSAG